MADSTLSILSNYFENRERYETIVKDLVIPFHEFFQIRQNCQSGFKFYYQRLLPPSLRFTREAKYPCSFLLSFVDKPKHSLLSVLAGVSAGTVIILITVIVCLCLEKKRKRNEPTRFFNSDVEKNNKAELQELTQLDGKTERNSDSAQSARSDDHVDSAFGDDEPRECNEYEANDDEAYLDAYLKAYNADKTLPRPPLPTKTRSDGSQRMSRRAHNDGSKGRNYDYNSNAESSFTTFS